MEQRHSLESEPTFVPNPTANLTASQIRIETYLDRTCASLFLSLPHEEALEQRAEMQSHLDHMVEAYIELGASETEAVAQALAQFGKEQSVAQAWKQECETTRAEAGRGIFWDAMRPILRYAAVNYLVFPLLTELCCYILNAYSRLGKVIPTILIWPALIVFLSEFTLFPAFLGFVAGRRVRGKALAASVLSLPLVYVTLGYLVLGFYRLIHLLPPAVHVSSQWQALTVPGLYLAFGGLGALAARWRRRKALRPAGNR